jgi:hypothetical protein
MSTFTPGCISVFLHMTVSVIEIGVAPVEGQSL